MLKGWLGGKGKAHQAHHTMSLNALDEIASLDDAMAAIMQIMNDDVDAAEAGLSKGHSPFHQLGKGVVTFIRATLGFEQDTMREASAQLSTAEDAAHEHQRRAAGNTSSYQSPIYPPGTEFALCLAEARLMSAVVGILNESLSEAVKAFYKLRKAYITLDSIAEAERKYLATKSTTSVGTSGSANIRKVPLRGGKASTASLSKSSTTSLPKSGLKEEVVLPAQPLVKETEVTQEKEKSKAFNDDDFEFVDADESHSGVATPVEYTGHLGAPTPTAGTPPVASTPQTRLKSAHPLATHTSASSPARSLQSSSSESLSDLTQSMPKLSLTETVKSGPDPSLYGDHPLDVFITSGTHFCFGILLLLISLVPPAFATLLKIVGFQGDRERGIQMLWQSTKYAQNINGAMAGIVLFGYYNALLGSCDIVAKSGPGSFPETRCRALLKVMRERYPNSHLWLLEEARMLAGDRKLEESVAFMERMTESPLQQLEALQWFERSLNLMYMHEYERSSQAFQKCATLNNWSHGLYFYICACAHVEAYRRALSASPPDAAEAAAQKTKAMALFEKVHPNLGRKKFMARQLPFDVFVSRKMQKWEARAKAWDCELVDAIGVSPIEELIYFWNGYKRMSPAHLEQSLTNLAWSESAPNAKYWEREDGVDEKAILAVLRATTLRSLGRTEEAKDLLMREVISVDRAVFRGGVKDSWTAPCARYEMAACLWAEVAPQLDDVDAGEGAAATGETKAKLEECGKWLVEVSAWEAYDLDARIGLKVTTAKGTMQRYGVVV